MKAAVFYAQEAVNYDNDKKYEAAIHSYLVFFLKIFLNLFLGSVKNNF